MNNIAYLNFKKLHEDAVIPEYAHEGDAGMDVTCVESFGLPPGATYTTMIGLAYTLTPGFEIQVRSRSGLARKMEIFVLNSPGTLDCNYREEVGVILHNAGEHFTTIHKGSRIAQLVVAKLPQVIISETETLDETDRTGGFGSSGGIIQP